MKRGERRLMLVLVLVVLLGGVGGWRLEGWIASPMTRLTGRVGESVEGFPVEDGSYDISLGAYSYAEGRYNVAIGFGERVEGGECEVRVRRLDAGTRYLLHDLGGSSWRGMERTMQAIEQHCGYGAGYLEGLVITALGPDGEQA